MSYLVFCSTEVGGFPYLISEVLRRNGLEVYYLSVDRWARGHNSTAFHFGSTASDWDLTGRLLEAGGNEKKIVRKLAELRMQLGIRHCFATGSRAYLLAAAGLQYKYWSYGADLDQILRLPRFPHNPLRLREWGGKAYWFFDRRRTLRSVAGAEAVLIAPYQWPLLQQLAPQKPMFFLPHVLQGVEYQTALERRRISRHLLTKRYGANRLFFSSTRHYWRYFCGEEGADSNNKGNDIAIAAFKEYLLLPGTQDDKLVLVKKGPDVPASARLIRRLGLRNNVIWINEVSRGELDDHYRAATACLGHFATPVLTYSVLEPVALGTPSVSFYSDPNLARVPYYEELPPVFNSKDPARIAEQLHLLASNEDRAREVSAAGLGWVERNCSGSNLVTHFRALFQR